MASRQPALVSPSLLLTLALALAAQVGCGPAAVTGASQATDTTALARSVSLVTTVFRDGSGTVTTAAFGTTSANELLLAFVASDGPLGVAQTVTVSGGGLTWTRVARTNAQAGTSEIWKAVAPAPLANITVRSVQSRSGYDQSLTVVALSGASGTGNVASASAASGAPSVTLQSSVAGSWVFAVGNDWDNAIARTLPPGQTMVHEWRDTVVGDDFWVQRLTTTTTAAGLPVLMNATAPTTDRWNLAAVEVLAGGSVPSTTPAPTFSPVPGTYPAPLAVTLSDTSSDATIYYTSDGTTPTSGSAIYGAPIPVSAATTIRAFAAAPGLEPSLVVTGQYGIQTAQINGHGIVLDGDGKLLSWLPQERAYSEIVDRVWNGFLNTIPLDGATGLPVYFLYPYVYPVTYSTPDWPHSPAGTFAMLTDSALLTYPFSGDAAMMAAIRAALSHHLARGMTTAGDAWSNVPYAESEPGSVTYSGAGSFGYGIGDGAGVLEPDKVAELAYAWLRFYEFDGTAAFRDAAIHCADQLVSHQRTDTSASVSPWPFRVRASDGAVVEAYTAHVIAAIRLFDELIRLGLGDTPGYRVARDAAWAWMMTYPMQNEVWCQYFEDVGIQASYDGNRNQYLPGNTARYLLEHPELDPLWLAHSQGMLAWIETQFGQSEVFGAIPIAEQFSYLHEMGSHTSRFGAVNALLYERTGDAAAKEKAYRALNWATYQNRGDGITVDGYPFPNQVWFTDSFGDYARHFMIALGAVPEWAPPGEDHLLRSSSVVQSVTYAVGRVEYRTFDSAAQEVLRLGFIPATVLADGSALPQTADLLQPGWTFNPALGVLRVRHDAGKAMIVLGTSPILTIVPATASTAPLGTVQFGVSGGSGTGYTWTLATNSSGGSIGAGTGWYVAGPNGSATDVVQVTDSLGNRSTRSITVTAGVSVSPLTASTAPLGTVQFSASGGSGAGYTWALATNASGATIVAGTGWYVAGPTASVTDVVQVTDSLGNQASRNVTVTGARTIVVDLTAFRDGSGTVTTAAFGTTSANELLLAFVASDGPLGVAQTVTVSGGGLTWTRVARTNAQAGTSEIWKAVAPAPLANVTVRSVQSRSGYDQSLTVVALSGASGTGSVASASAASGAPSVTLQSSVAGSWVFAVGNDWDNAIARTLPPGQTMVHEWRDTVVGDDFWVQRLTTTTTAAGLPVLMNATAPTTDRWNLAAVEVIPR